MCQEFALSQKYHEGLLKLQQKDYAKARELLEDVLKDPLISNVQAMSPFFYMSFYYQIHNSD